MAKKQGLIPTSDRRSLNEEITDLEESARHLRCMVAAYQLHSDQAYVEREIARHQTTIDKAQAEIDRLLDYHLNWEKRLAETQKRLVETERRAKVLRNKNKVEQLLRLQKELEELEAVSNDEA